MHFFPLTVCYSHIFKRNQFFLSYTIKLICLMFGVSTVKLHLFLKTTYFNKLVR